MPIYPPEPFCINMDEPPQIIMRKDSLCGFKFAYAPEFLQYFIAQF